VTDEFIDPTIIDLCSMATIEEGDISLTLELTGKRVNRSLNLDGLA
jgi:hypothetical protein